LAAAVRAFMGDVTQDLDRIGQPVVVLYGERDAIAAAGGSKFASLDQVEYAVLPRIGHEVFADAPRRALERIDALLDRQLPQ
jgi:pimeloyl-ACP methyl ester carboxylesterase